MKALLCCAICVVFVGSALAYGGSDYLKHCRVYIDDSSGTDYEDGLHDGICMGYTRGVIEADQIWHQMIGPQTFCLPDGANPDQFVRVAVKYLEDNPAQLHYNAAFSIHLALREAFPCTGGN